MSNPTFVYKLIPSSSPLPDALPLKLPLSALDEASGFIHLSTGVQIPGTLRRFFKSEPKVYVLRIPFDKVEKDIRWESPDAKVCGSRPGEGLFPHLYNGGKLGSEEVESVAEWVNVDVGREDGGGWDDALQKAEAWLV
ncbi:hypothetical protein M378DRAFT_172886 [Amanita muscaria Koide BX008]|uniref:DUF952 domain protein n=1 Tax=Amanita muscaria (strain Koide BX008) TaxID=946122 RepID=A0A0C2S0Q8_AMAMK|nr:hypothetical protein M378DRAFT_172886 [Amanita muscaria Koide BX008]